MLLFYVNLRPDILQTRCIFRPGPGLQGLGNLLIQIALGCRDFFYIDGLSLFLVLHCVSKKIPGIFGCNFKISYQILIICGVNIPDTTCHQMTI